MKHVRRIICCILVLSFLLILPVAAEDQGGRASSFFVATRTFLERTEGNKFAICFEVTAKRRMEELGARSIVIQRSADGITWRTTYTCLPSSYPQMMREDTIVHSDLINYSGLAGYYYKAKVTYYADDGTSTGTFTTWTSVLQLPSN